MSPSPPTSIAPEPDSPPAGVPAGLPARAAEAATPALDTSHHLRLVVPIQLSPSDHPRLASLIRRLAPGAGEAKEFGGGLLWEEDSGFRAVALTIAPEHGVTVIRADLRLDGRQFAYGLGAVVTALFSGLSATHWLPGLPSLAIGLGALLPAGLIVRQLWRRSVARAHAELGEMVQRIGAALRGELD